jgi:hypothetical protein
MSNAEEIRKLFSEIKDQDPRTLRIISQYVKELNKLYDEDAELFENIGKELPKLGIASYVYPTYLEFIFVSWLEELTGNYPLDYGTKDANSLVNDNSMVITNAYNELMRQDGQYPKAVVQCGGVSSGVMTVGDDFRGVSSNESFNILGGKEQKGAQMNAGMTIYAAAMNYNEANILGGAIFGALIESRACLRKVFQLQQVSYPQLSTASPIRQNEKVFAARISFNVMEIFSWAEILKIKEYKNLVVRLNAKFAKCDTYISQILGTFPLPIDSKFKEYLDSLEQD